MAVVPTASGGTGVAKLVGVVGVNWAGRVDSLDGSWWWLVQNARRKVATRRGWGMALRQSQTGQSVGQTQSEVLRKQFMAHVVTRRTRGRTLCPIQLDTKEL